MTLIPHANDKSVPAPKELRRQVARATGRLRDTAAHVGRLVEDKTPDPVRAGAFRTATRVRDTAARAGRLTGRGNLDSARARAGRAAKLARSHRTALATAAGVLTAAVIARRSRRARPAKR
ncbi:hypothetical protein ABTX80_28640 [Streptomyces erythrochromogenes]|uniref:hypothetical protein n=1 Tax=Streptomyces erythrochromogenes TaxID=285574 RepID=UPI003318C719